MLYTMAMQPALARKTCAQLGYGFVSVDPVFAFMLYWKGGAWVFNDFATPYLKMHPLFMPILNASRDENPACSYSTFKTILKVPRIIEFGVSRIAGSFHGQAATAVLYDANRIHAECVEGPVEYMEHCVLKSNWYSYLRMAQPTLHHGTCAEIGYEFVSIGRIFQKSKIYWKGGVTAFDAFARPYFKAHPDMEAMLSKTRDANPACKSITNSSVWIIIVMVALLGLAAVLLLLCMCLRRRRLIRVRFSTGLNGDDRAHLQR